MTKDEPVSSVGLIDTHCHIHDDEFPLEAEQVLADARDAGICGLICVGTSAKYSRQAIDFATQHKNVWATVGLHPHDAVNHQEMDKIEELATEQKVVAVGECGLDYYYDNSPREIQQEVLIKHFEIAKKHNLPMSFHIRGKQADSADAYEDFWAIYDKYDPPGVVHSFSAHEDQLEQILERDLFVGVNGIATFMKPGPQFDAIREIPLRNLLLETDSPLLTPVPYRGKINEPKHTSTIQKFLASARAQTTGEIGEHTSRNAAALFGITCEPHN